MHRLFIALFQDTRFVSPVFIRNLTRAPVEQNFFILEYLEALRNLINDKVY